MSFKKDFVWGEGYNERFTYLCELSDTGKNYKRLWFLV